MAIIVAGMAIGWFAQWILGNRTTGQRTDWAMALVAGVGGSFVGGLIFSLIAGDGLALKPSGIIGSVVGAIIVTLIWKWVERRNATPARDTARRH
jgi:uncharacterized membrane protein YeaQ/YmgE (transglycosylase-associated protein family)